MLDYKEVAGRDRVWQLTQVTRHDRVVFEDAANPLILDVVQDLLGSGDIKLFSDQTPMKPVFHGSPVSWHQDSAAWSTVPPGVVSCWVALDDVTTENGCVLMISGSHRLGLIEHRRDTFLHAQGIDLDRAAPLVMPVGRGGFHNCLAVHGSGPNRTPHRRCALVSSDVRADVSWVGDQATKPMFALLRGREQPGGL